MTYQINDLEQLTGIKAHTLRIWEKRYNLIESHRTPTNIRYYDDSQARKLLNISALVNAGEKISRVAALSEEELHLRVVALQGKDSVALAHTSYITRLISSMLSFDEEEFAQLIDEVTERYGVEEAMIQIIYPFLVKVGVLWSTNDAMPAQEHFASNIIRRKLIAETAKLPALNGQEVKKVLLFLPPDEWHEIGLLLTDFLARNNGYKTIYLGQNVPFENVLLTYQRIRPHKLISFYILPKKKINIPAGFKQLADQLTDASLIVCGRKEMLDQIPSAVRMQLCSTPEEMLPLLTNA